MQWLSITGNHQVLIVWLQTSIIAPSSVKWRLMTLWHVVWFLIVGLKLRMLGVTKAKLAPLVKPQLMKYKTHIVPLVRKKGSIPIVLHYPILHLHLNPLRPNVSMYILHAVRFTFPKVLMRRICLVKSIFGDHVLHSHDCDVWFRADIVRRN